MENKRLREQMVKSQLETRGIKNPEVLKAFLSIPREIFVPDRLKNFAYEDRALPLAKGQTISQPFMAAFMTEQLKLNGAETVLEIGTGSGYQTAILAKICRKVYSLERITELSGQARETLSSLKLSNIEFIVGDGTLGYPAGAPYQAILVTAAAPTPPPPLLKQLVVSGRLVIPLGPDFQQVLTTITRKNGGFSSEQTIPCVFVPLIGKFGARV